MNRTTGKPWPQPPHIVPAAGSNRTTALGVLQCFVGNLTSHSGDLNQSLTIVSQSGFSRLSLEPPSLTPHQGEENGLLPTKETNRFLNDRASIFAGVYNRWVKGNASGGERARHIRR
ncbi:hypothetical protein RIF29_09649 [Crotalaria pallida]|uniref:Uncharacterized protein n=1 Tax=Crotalaria pallida TaxID=3830 RepID=A0AAN9FS33_CROPI